eukprot:COSAG01_NODE_3523_length_5972_cov_2.681307_2_plen_111_part_00
MEEWICREEDSLLQFLVLFDLRPGRPLLHLPLQILRASFQHVSCRQARQLLCDGKSQILINRLRRNMLRHRGSCLALAVHLLLLALQELILHPELADIHAHWADYHDQYQ